MKARLAVLFSRPMLWVAAVALGALGLLAGLGCYPGEVNSIEELDLVVTQFDSTHAWTAPATFYLLDSVVHLTDTSDAGNNITLTRAFDSLALAETRKGLLGYGYTEKNTPDSADYSVIVSALAVQNWTVDVWYPYWPYYGYGWGWYYPPVYDVDTYTTGTVFIDMYDQNRVDSTNQLVPRPWNALLNGVMGTAASVTQTRLQQGIRQAFAQSPYLKPQ